MGVALALGGPLLVWLPAWVILELAPAGVPTGVLRATHRNLRGAALLFLAVIDAHRYISKLQNVIDPSGHLLLYGCAALSLAPLLVWFVSKIRRGSNAVPPTQVSDQAVDRAKNPATSSGPSRVPQDAGVRSAAEDKDGLVHACGILVVLFSAVIAYFSATTAIFFHPTPDSGVTAALIAAAALALPTLLPEASPRWRWVESVALGVWLVGKCAVFAIAASQVFTSLHPPLAALGVPFRVVGGGAFPPIKLESAAQGLIYDVFLVVCVFLFRWRAPFVGHEKQD